MEIFRQIDKTAAAAECGEHLNAFLIEHKKQPILLMLSGGSALSILDYLGDHALGENLTVSVLDERFMAYDESIKMKNATQSDLSAIALAKEEAKSPFPEQDTTGEGIPRSDALTRNGKNQNPATQTEINNFAQLQKTEFYTAALNAEVSFFGTLPRPNETADELAKRFEKNLKTWREKNLDGIIVATFGMGPDGHTAGIFPNPDEHQFNKLFNSGAWVVPYNVGDKSEHPERVTTTLNFFRNITAAFAYVCGGEKKEKFKQLENHQDHINTLPALAWYDIKDVKVFTDIK